MIKRLTQVYGSVAKRIFDTGFKITGGTAERTLQERFQDLINSPSTSGQLNALGGEDNTTDDITTISDANTYAGKIVFMRPALASVPITVKTTGGNIRTKTDFVMNNSMDIVQLMYVGGFWIEVSRSDNK